MTKEELKQEAEEYYEDETEGTFQICEDCYWFADAVQTAYVDSAEPREKRIAELEQENKELIRDKQNLRADLRTARNNLEAKDTVYHLTTEELNCVITNFNTFKSEAKELLKKFIESSNPIYFEEDRQKVKAEAEQFLKENE